MINRKGFTLVELVVVVMILGILAAVAAPKLLGTSGTATDNGVRQTLAVVRDAIERYAAENGGDFPGEADGLEATFKANLAPYLRGTFPTCPVGDNKDAEVAMSNTTTSPLGVDASATKGWRYSYKTGDFIVNSANNDNSTPAVPYNEY
jgi:prepilin-type N-terminal cleavage/methylation domain-containing protein